MLSGIRFIKWQNLKDHPHPTLHQTFLRLPFYLLGRSLFRMLRLLVKPKWALTPFAPFVAMLFIRTRALRSLVRRERRERKKEREVEAVWLLVGRLCAWAWGSARSVRYLAPAVFPVGCPSGFRSLVRCSVCGLFWASTLLCLVATSPGRGSHLSLALFLAFSIFKLSHFFDNLSSFFDNIVVAVSRRSREARHCVIAIISSPTPPPPPTTQQEINQSVTIDGVRYSLTIDRNLSNLKPNNNVYNKLFPK
jgi:hypothetical protein